MKVGRIKDAVVASVIASLVTGCGVLGPYAENGWVKITSKDQAERARDDKLLSLVMEQYHQQCNQKGGEWYELPGLPNADWRRIYNSLISDVVVLPNGQTISKTSRPLSGWQAYIGTMHTNYSMVWKSAQCRLGVSETRSPVADVQAHLDAKGFLYSGSAVFGGGIFPVGLKRWSPVDVEILLRQADNKVNLD